MVWLWENDGPADGDRIDFVTDDLAVTDLVSATDLGALTRHGIRAVVDASNRAGNPRFPGIRYHEVGIEDPDERLTEYLPDLMAFIDEARRSGPVLVHCVAGISRSPALAICYLHERHGLSLPAALEQVRSRRPIAAPHPVFLRLIDAYYQTRIVAMPGQAAAFGGQRSPRDGAEDDRKAR